MRYCTAQLLCGVVLVLGARGCVQFTVPEPDGININSLLGAEARPGPWPVAGDARSSRGVDHIYQWLGLRFDPPGIFVE